MKKIYKVNSSSLYKAIKLLLESYFHGQAPIEFDYSKIREAGIPIKGFGGGSSGPEPLKDVHQSIRKVLDLNSNEPISVTTIVDIMNLIGKCVVAGNVRRSAALALGQAEDKEYLTMKNDQEKLYHHRF